MQRLGQERKAIAVVDDQYGGPTYAGDLTDAMLKIVDYFQTTGALDWGIYHY